MSDKPDHAAELAQGETEKDRVQQFWDRASCGEELFLRGIAAEDYLAQAAERYRLEPYIAPFAKFDSTRGQRVLEIGVGLGADHEQFGRAGADLWGVDLTPRAVEHTGRRFAALGLKTKLSVGDAERLPVSNDFFDVVYSWGVIHHSPDTSAAVREIFRVLKPGGECRVMIYHKYSLVGYMLWVRYALLTLRWSMTLADIYSVYLESPGTKAYSVSEALELFSNFTNVKAWPVLTHGDLLTSDAGQRHRGTALSLARILWPRKLLNWLLPEHGLALLVLATKPNTDHALLDVGHAP